MLTRPSRDASTANGSLVNTLTPDQAQQLQQQIRKAQEDARAAQLIGSVIDEKIGDIAKKNKWAEGSTEKTILHGLSGAIQAGIAGGNVVADAAAGALNEQLVPVMRDYLIKEGIKEGTAEFNEFMALGSTLAGAAVGAVTAGTQGAAIGGSVAHTGTVYNFLTHSEATRRAELMAQQLACKDDTCHKEKQAEINKLNQLDAWRDQQIAAACQSPGSDLCKVWVAEIQIAAASYKDKTVSDTLVGAERSRPQCADQIGWGHRSDHWPAFAGYGPAY